MKRQTLRGVGAALSILVTGLVAALSGCAAHETRSIVRGIYADPSAAIDNRLWASYGGGYELDANVPHQGKVSIRCANQTDREGRGASQSIRINQDKARPIVVAGWAKLEGVSGAPDYHCSVYLDLTLKGGQGWPMKIAAFDPAKPGWQYSEQVYTPPAPVESARVHVFLRERKGTAWFDDIYVGEIMDNKGTRSPNFLADPGFEGGASRDTSLRDQFFAKLKEIGCDSFHFYRSVGWEKIMSVSAPPLDEKDKLLVDFIRDAHKRGYRVWLTVGVDLPKIENTKSPDFPFWPCVNGRWGEGYTRALAYFAQYGVDGIGMVPDEWNYDNSAVSNWAKHPDPEVAAFYKKMPSFCDCDVCRKLFREKTGHEYPDVRKPWSTSDPVWAEFTKFRYNSTAAWIRRSVEAVKKVNPKIVTDTMICVLPVCSDNRLHTGAAWDQIGVETGLDCLQTDPYIQLHNYLGDSTHWYPTETAIHLTCANWKARSGVTLEACKLREEDRDKEPAEVYGAAFSCLAHGAREFFWWHFNFVQGKVKWVDPESPSRQLAATYQVMKAMEPDLVGARTPGDLLVVYSRVAEDTWDWLAGVKGAPPEIFGEKPDRKRGFIAHHNVLYWLLRRGYPFQTTFLDNPDPQRLAAAKVLIVPFPFSLKESEVKTLEEQANAGKTVILMSELSPADEMGQPLAQPRLARLFGGRSMNPRAEGVIEADLGQGKVIFLGGDFAVRLFAEMKPVKGPLAVVPLPVFDPTRAAQMEKLLASAMGRPVSLFAEQPGQDVEAALFEGPNGPMLLLINWDFTQPAKVRLRRPAENVACMASGYAIMRDATVAPIQQTIGTDPWEIVLSPQEARLLKITNAPRPE